MSVWENLLGLIGSPQWHFVYHFIVLLALAAAWAIVFGQRRLFAPTETHPVLWGLALLLVLRLGPALLLPLDSAGWLVLASWMPVLERALDTASLVVLVWALVLPHIRWRGIRGPFLVAQVLLIGLAAAGLSRIWAGELSAGLSYTASWHRFLWIGWQFLLALLGILGLWRAEQPRRHMVSLAIMFFLMALAQVLEAALPAPFPAPAWERAAALLGYPLLAISMTQMVTGRLEISAGGEPAFLVPLRATNTAEMLLETLGPEDEASETDGMPEDAPEAVAGRLIGPLARALGVDQAAFGLLEGGLEDRMRLVAVYNPTRQGRGGEVVSFPLDEQMAIRRALRRKELVLVGGADDIVQLRFLYALMGSRETGPLLVHPLVYEGRAIGALVAGNSQSKQPFSFAQTQLAARLAGWVAPLLAAPRLLHSLRQRLEQSEKTLRAREEEWGARLESLNQELEQERQSARLFAQRLASLERAAEEKQRELERISRRLLLQEEEARRSQQEAAALNRKLESMVKLKLNLEDEIRGYREQIQELERMLSESRQHDGQG